MKTRFSLFLIALLVLIFSINGRIYAQSHVPDETGDGKTSIASPHPAEIAHDASSEKIAEKSISLPLIATVIVLTALAVALGFVMKQRRDGLRALAQSEQRLRAMLEASKDVAFITTDLAGRNSKILDFSSGAESLLGYTRNEVIGSSVATLYADEEHETLDKVYSAEETQDHPLTTEHTLVRKSGEEFPGIMTTYAIHSEQGEAHTALGLAVDMSDSRKSAGSDQRTLAQMQHAEKLEGLESLAGGVAHDFNNMLVGVLGNADLALMDLAPLSPARASVEQIKTAAIEASELTRQLLAYAGKGHFVIELVNLNHLVKGIAQLLRASVSKKVIIDYDFAEDLPPVEVDTSQIRQLLVSLVTNASDAMKGNSGRISITTKEVTVSTEDLASAYLDDDLPTGDYVSLGVADSGPGMDEATAERIFDPFFTTKESGRGIGLAAVLGIVRGHKGAISVESNPGKGSEFHVLLPASDKELLTEEEFSGRNSANSEEVSETVLIVDDEETVRRVTSAMLSRHGYTVLTASNGREGVNIFRENADQIDVVLLNMTMPELSGPEAFKMMRNIDPKARVILCTGFGEKDSRESFEDEGLAGFIQKPFEMDALLGLFKEVLSS